MFQIFALRAKIWNIKNEKYSKQKVKSRSGRKHFLLFTFFGTLFSNYKAVFRMDVLQ
jgi:hypothetical protein